MIPRSGGEKVYLEAVYKKPRYLASVMFAANAIILGFTAAGCVVCFLTARPHNRSKLTSLGVRAEVGYYVKLPFLQGLLTCLVFLSWLDELLIDGSSEELQLEACRIVIRLTYTSHQVLFQ